MSTMHPKLINIIVDRCQATPHYYDFYWDGYGSDTDTGNLSELRAQHILGNFVGTAGIPWILSAEHAIDLDLKEEGGYGNSTQYKVHSLGGSGERYELIPQGDNDTEVPPLPAPGKDARIVSIRVLGDDYQGTTPPREHPLDTLALTWDDGTQRTADLGTAFALYCVGSFIGTAAIPVSLVEELADATAGTPGAPATLAGFLASSTMFDLDEDDFGGEGADQYTKEGDTYHLIAGGVYKSAARELF